MYVPLFDFIRCMYGIYVYMYVCMYVCIVTWRTRTFWKPTKASCILRTKAKHPERRAIPVPIPVMPVMPVTAIAALSVLQWRMSMRPGTRPCDPHCLCCPSCMAWWRWLSSKTLHAEPSVSHTYIHIHTYIHTYIQYLYNLCSVSPDTCVGVLRTGSEKVKKSRGQ